MAQYDLLDTLVKLREELLAEHLFHNPENSQEILEQLRDTQSRIWFEVARCKGTVPESMKRVIDGSVNEVEIPRYLTDKEVDRLQKWRDKQLDKRNAAANAFLSACLSKAAGV